MKASSGYGMVGTLLVGFGVTVAGCAATDEGNSQGQTEAHVSAESTLRNCGFALPKGNEAVELSDCWSSSKSVRVEPGTPLRVKGPNFKGDKIEVSEKLDDSLRSLCVDLDALETTCPAGAKTAPFVALRDTQMLSSLPISAGTQWTCRIPTGTLIEAKWDTSNNGTYGYIHVNLKDGFLPDCPTREGYLPQVDLSVAGRYYYGQPTEALSKVQQELRKQGLLGACEAPQVLKGDACVTVASPPQCPVGSVRKDGGSDGESCVAQSATDRGIKPGEWVVVAKSYGVLQEPLQVLCVSGSTVTVRAGEHTFGGPGAGDAPTPRTENAMAIARYVDAFGGLRAGDTFLRQVDGNRRIRRVVSLTDQGWVEVEQLTIDGKSFNVDSVKRWLSPEEAQLYLRAEGQAVNTAFKPGMSLEFPKAPFGTATVLEDRGAQVLVTYMGNANGSLARLEVEVPRDDVRPMIQEKDGVGVGRTYFHRTTTKSAEVKEIYPSGDVKYLELDSVQSGINYRTATLDSFQRAYLVRVDDVPATNAAEHPQP